MTDKLSEGISQATETEIKAANEANKKYKNVSFEDKHILTSSVGTSILDTEEKVVDLTDKAMVDQVTGLPNERAFEEMIQGLEGRWNRDRFVGTFVVADLTGLHEANDKYGRAAGGDDYLRAVRGSFAEVSREGDRSFRMGTSADEFVHYLPDINSEKVINGVLDRVDTSLLTAQNEYQAQYKGIQFGLSYSISSFGENISPRQAASDAMNALGKAKESKNGDRVGSVGRKFV